MQLYSDLEYLVIEDMIAAGIDYKDPAAIKKYWEDYFSAEKYDW